MILPYLQSVGPPKAVETPPPVSTRNETAKQKPQGPSFAERLDEAKPPKVKDTARSEVSTSPPEGIPATEKKPLTKDTLKGPGIKVGLQVQESLEGAESISKKQVSTEILPEDNESQTEISFPEGARKSKEKKEVSTIDSESILRGDNEENTSLETPVEGSEEVTVVNQAEPQAPPKEVPTSSIPSIPTTEVSNEAPTANQATAQVQIIDLRSLDGKKLTKKSGELVSNEVIRAVDPRKAQFLVRETTTEITVPRVEVGTPLHEVELESLVSEKTISQELVPQRVVDQGTRTNPWALVVHRIFGRDLENPEQTRSEQREARVVEVAQLGDLSQRMAAQKMESVVFGGGMDSSKLVEHLRNAGAFEIVRSAKFILKDNDQGEIKLILKPEKLGEVKIHLTLADNSIGAQILVDNKEVEEAFAQTLEDLKQAFRDQGFETADFLVRLRDPGEQFAPAPENNAGDDSRVDLAV